MFGWRKDKVAEKENPVFRLPCNADLRNVILVVPQGFCDRMLDEGRIPLKLFSAYPHWDFDQRDGNLLGTSVGVCKVKGALDQSYIHIVGSPWCISIPKILSKYRCDVLVFANVHAKYFSTYLDDPKTFIRSEMVALLRDPTVVSQRLHCNNGNLKLAMEMIGHATVVVGKEFTDDPLPEVKFKPTKKVPRMAAKGKKSAGERKTV